MPGKLSWLFGRVEQKSESEWMSSELKCRICGAETRKQERVCPVCGFATRSVQETPVTLQDNSPARSYVNEATQTIDTPDDADAWYDKAREECRCGRNEEAIRSLQKACQLDGLCASLAEGEHDFKTIKTDPRFTELVQKRREELREHPNPRFYSTEE